MRAAHSQRSRAGTTLVALLLCACARDASAVRLVASSPRDEIYRISCKDDIHACRDEAARACKGGYQVLESTGARVEPPRVTSAPGPSSTGPRYQRDKWLGQMVVACGNPAAAQGTAATESADPSAVPPVAVRPTPERLCIPGITQLCLGPAACRGAQACLPDGNGYGPCDCGELHTSAGESRDAGAPSGT